VSAYTAAPLPPELWPGSQERWGVKAPDGEWLLWARPSRAYSFVNAGRAQAYADQCNSGVSRAVAANDRQA
jgi:hypothetical protein